MFHLKDFLGTTLDRMGYRMPVGRAERQRLEDEHVESSLRHFTLKRRFTPWHSRNILHSMIDLSMANGILARGGLMRKCFQRQSTEYTIDKL